MSIAPWHPIPGLCYGPEEIGELKALAKNFAESAHLYGGADASAAALGGAELLRTAIALAVHGDYPETQREVVMCLWKFAGVPFRQAFSRAFVAALFRSAQFPLPPTLPEQFTIWRGGRANDPAMVASGYSWTTSYRVAAGYAISPEFLTDDCIAQRPVLVSAKADRSSVVYRPVSSAVQEVILDHEITAFENDSNLSHWIPIGLRENDARIWRTMAILESEHTDPFIRQCKTEGMASRGAALAKCPWLKPFMQGA